MKDVFNWLAAKPAHQYTLFGDSNSIKFNRAARFVERVVSVPPMVVGVAMMAVAVPTALVAPPAAATLILGGLAVAAFGKAAGLIKGGIAHLAAAGASSLANHLSKPHTQTAPKAG
ncbi:MAG TPA: hypothetical protein VEF76_05655 [Patescibacteria group bacterium]|nr:hypothetical protein [Patescibacteria group bacterium]